MSKSFERNAIAMFRATRQPQPVPNKTYTGPTHSDAGLRELAAVQNLRRGAFQSHEDFAEVEMNLRRYARANA